MRESLRAGVRKAVRPIIDRASRGYVAGKDLASALRVCRHLRAQGVAATLCFWDGPDDGPELTAGHYLSIVEALGQEDIHAYVSVKAPALRYSRALFEQVLDRARRRQVRVHFDALRLDTAAPTFSLIRDLHPRNGDAGCTLPGRWRRSLADADRVVELDLKVRVVKGQWADPDDAQRDPRAGFLAVIDRLTGKSRGVSVATHDPALAREALLRLRSRSTPCELELLFGLPTRKVIPIAKDMAVPVRYYIPYGHAWLPYALGELRKNPWIAWWAIRDLVCSGFGTVYRISAPSV